MAVVQGSTLYTGSVSGDIIYRIKNGIGLEWGKYIKTEINVDGQPRQLTKANHSTDPLQANIKNPRDADYAASTATTTIDGRQLSVTDLMVIEHFDIENWKTTFPQYQPSGLNVDLKANPEIQATVFELVMNAAHQQLQNLHSAGDAALIAPNPLRWYDGFTTLILADGDATQVGTPAVLDSSNILDQMFGLRDAISPRLRANPNLKIFCSYADGDLFDRAARNTQDAQVITSLQGVRSLTQTNGSNIPVLQMEGIPKDFVFATISAQSGDSNLTQGVWVDGDFEALKMYKSEEADQIHKIIMRFSVGVQHKTGEDIFYLNNV